MIAVPHCSTLPRRRPLAVQLAAVLLAMAALPSAAQTSTDTSWIRFRNEPARRLYEKLAFRQLGRRRGYYANPPEDAVLYALQFVS